MSSESRTDDKVRRCPDCGTQSSPGRSFCDGCGAVLHWAPDASSGDAEEASSANGAVGTERPATDQASAPDPDRTGAETVSSRQPATTSVPSSAAGERPGPGSTGTPSGEGAGDEEVADDAESEKGEDDVKSDAALLPLPGTEPASASERVRALLVPVEEASVQIGSSVAPVLPGRPAVARPEVYAPQTDVEATGGVPCPWCATLNRPDRHFCRRCALRMSGEEQRPEHRPWWRRLLDFRKKETPWAGERPRLRREFWQLIRWAVGAALAVVLVVLAAFGVVPATRAVRDHFAKRVPVIPDQYAASHSFSGHDPEKAFDRVSNTWWGPGYSGAGQGQWIEARFNRPVRLLDLVITPGVSPRPDQISQSALPQQIDALITTVGGKIEKRTVTLDDGGVQRRSFHNDNVIAVRFVLHSAYGASPTKQVAIAEIEFFGPSSGS